MGWVGYSSIRNTVQQKRWSKNKVKNNEIHFLRGRQKFERDSLLTAQAILPSSDWRNTSSFSMTFITTRTIPSRFLNLSPIFGGSLFIPKHQEWIRNLELALKRPHAIGEKQEILTSNNYRLSTIVRWYNVLHGQLTYSVGNEGTKKRVNDMGGYFTVNELAKEFRTYPKTICRRLWANGIRPAGSVDPWRLAKRDITWLRH